MQVTTTTTELAPVKVGRAKGNIVKVLGFDVRVGTKRHEKLIQLKNRLDDLNTSETAVVVFTGGSRILSGGYR